MKEIKGKVKFFGKEKELKGFITQNMNLHCR